ncbi:MAG: repair protein RecN [Pseudomonadota bacterium]|jgi:DNA repair protein RecN (Recombination protein N)
MLNQLVIRNYAIVDNLEMDYRPGMTVITGETGAGKSIILGALGLTLGDRADKTVVRSGADKADISALFQIADYPEVQAWLADHELQGDDPHSCLLRRVVGEDGRSRAFINGAPVTLANLSELGDRLMDIHSQHEHQSLLKRTTHQRQLDAFGVPADLLEQLRRVWRQWHDNQQLIQQLSNQSRSQDAQMQLLGYQVRELDELALEPGEVGLLDAEFLQLNTADTTISVLQQVLSLCLDDEEHAVHQAIHRALTVLGDLPHLSPGLQAVVDLLNNALIHIEEAGDGLRQELERVEVNPQRLEEVNRRLAQIHAMARKHRVKPDELTVLHQDLARQVKAYENTDASLETLRKQDQALRRQYQDIAGQVSAKRHSAAQSLGKQINQQLKSLGMAEARLEVRLSPLEGDLPAAEGMETVEFLVSTNPGQPAKPLAKIASGGELSRISLAIQVITARTSKTPTLVFDEVDVGIGGGVAREVGKLLRQLGEHAQILCVTHQAQVASQGHQHYLVSKASRGKSTNTTITELVGEQKVREIARMLGGDAFTEESLAHAEQMIGSPV